ncbi:MAG TPA: hypothetical protein VHI13_08825 [Candidatus Kapabacteria bacterium]|nr:hypothetical protein [Candidatus Kapabacteria bacterium]
MTAPPANVQEMLGEPLRELAGNLIEQINRRLEGKLTVAAFPAGSSVDGRRDAEEYGLHYASRLLWTRGEDISPVTDEVPSSDGLLALAVDLTSEILATAQREGRRIVSFVPVTVPYGVQGGLVLHGNAVLSYASQIHDGEHHAYRFWLCWHCLDD